MESERIGLCPEICFEEGILAVDCGAATVQAVLVDAQDVRGYTGVSRFSMYSQTWVLRTFRNGQVPECICSPLPLTYPFPRPQAPAIESYKEQVARLMKGRNFHCFTPCIELYVCPPN